VSAATKEGVIMLQVRRFALLIFVVVVTAFNVTILVLNLALPIRAAVGGLDYQALVADSDFKKAVQSIVETCRVNVDVGKVRC
jgi:glucose uptake protein GlcU